MDVAFATLSLGMEAAEVIGLRTIRAAGGGPRAADEAWRMYTEKLISSVQLQGELMAGLGRSSPLDLSRKAVRHYRTRVAANRRRLAR